MATLGRLDAVLAGSVYVRTLKAVLSDTTPGMRAKVVGISTGLIIATVVLWALAIVAAIPYPSILPSALLAFTLGLRHAFDVDHISAIDNVTRKLMQEGKKPVSVGFFFSMGHSTVVFIMTALVAAGSTAISSNLASDTSALRSWGGLVGTSVAALFLFAIGIMNLIVLVQIIQIFRSVTKGNPYEDHQIADYLNQLGFFARIFRPLFKNIDTSWKMYPVGFVFGLGFETATEIALLTASGSFAAQNTSFFAVMLLPLLFAAGMSLADTTNGVLMLGAYGWAFVKPIRKLFYNVSITAISVTVALLVGTLETLSIVAGRLRLSDGFWSIVTNGNEQFGLFGILIAAAFALSWLIAAVIYRVKQYDELEVIAPAAEYLEED